MAGGICPVDSEKTPERWGFKGGERAGRIVGFVDMVCCVH